MKLILYAFYHSALTAKENKPQNGWDRYYHSAICEVGMFLTIVASLVLYKLSNELNVWHLVIQYWPYDYGEMHGKNFLAPAGVIVFLIYLFIYLSLRKSILKSGLAPQIMKSFRGKETKKQRKWGSWTSPFLFIWGITSGLLLQFEQFSLFLMCLFILGFMEYKVRRILR